MLASAVKKWTDKLILINTIERLVVGYHFSSCIEDLLAEIHESHAYLETYEKYDLVTTALCFRIFWQDGYNVKSGNPEEILMNIANFYSLSVDASKI